MKKLSLLFLIILLYGCANIEPVEFVGPNGKPAYSMKCSGMGKTLDACYIKAGEICSKGYSIIDNRTDTKIIPVNGSVLATPQRFLAIECK